ncbi:MAG: 3-deoxy-D-manno-octulosonic acid transferase, partial [Prolixibacteraceae bacterium]|nr:3-deoxy-D-manno-octulosonic acid transferase [Prolixibacteraceae bacterium]
MMQILYDIAIFFYGLLASTASLFNKKAKLMVRGRRNALAALKSYPRKEGQYIWFHCASLGEFEQGRPVMEAV